MICLDGNFDGELCSQAQARTFYPQQRAGVSTDDLFANEETVSRAPAALSLVWRDLVSLVEHVCNVLGRDSHALVLQLEDKEGWLLLSGRRPVHHQETQRDHSFHGREFYRVCDDVHQHLLEEPLIQLHENLGPRRFVLQGPLQLHVPAHGRFEVSEERGKVLCQLNYLGIYSQVVGLHLVQEQNLVQALNGYLPRSHAVGAELGNLSQGLARVGL